MLSVCRRRVDGGVEVCRLCVGVVLTLFCHCDGRVSLTWSLRVGGVFVLCCESRFHFSVEV